MSGGAGFIERSGRLQRLLASLGLAATVCFVAGCPPTPPTEGDLQIVAFNDILFDYAVAQDPVVFNSAQLNASPLIPMNSETLKYQDGFSTTPSPTYIIVTARDPNEQETSLESIVGPLSAQSFIFQIVGPPDVSTEPAGLPSNTVTLPDGYGIPFGTAGVNGTSWPLAISDFTGSPSVSIVSVAPTNGFPGPALPLPFIGVQGVYLQRLGVCAYDVDSQKIIVDQLTSTVPPLIDQQIDQKAPCSPAASTEVQAASFMNRNSIVSPYGGVVGLFNVLTDFQDCGGFIGPAVDSMNYTFTFALTSDGNTSQTTSGIFTVVPALNGDYYEGTVVPGKGNSGQGILNALEALLPSTIANTVYLQALAKQAQPIPTSVLNPLPECQGNGNKPSTCYEPCRLPDGFTPPPNLDPGGNVDDSSWYDTSYCGTAANLILPGAVAKGAAIYGITDPTTQTSIGALFEQTRASNPSLYKYVRCNFYPTYETVNPSNPFAPPVPVCEVVTHAKRLNVLPDQVELVWFDGPNLAPVSGVTNGFPNPGVGTDEYSNEAFASYLALLGAGSDPSILCNSTYSQYPTPHHFAHGQGFQ